MLLLSSYTYLLIRDYIHDLLIVYTFINGLIGQRRRGMFVGCCPCGLRCCRFLLIVTRILDGRFGLRKIMGFGRICRSR